MAMNGGKIPNAQVTELLELADWAPTHANTEPWRFIVYEDPLAFCKEHAELYKQNNAATFEVFNYEKLLRQGDKTSHIIVAIMKRGDLPKIPPIEEIAAASCAIQNLLLGATALNIASFWSTGGMALKPAFIDALGFDEDDHVLGILYLGYADHYPEGKRNIPLEEKINWVR